MYRKALRYKYTSSALHYNVSLTVRSGENALLGTEALFTHLFRFLITLKTFCFFVFLSSETRICAASFSTFEED